MLVHKLAVVGVCLGIAAAASPIHAQCTQSQNAAVQCFAANALKTGRFTLHYGMSQSQFKTYSISVLKIMQARDTNLVLFGMSSAVADAMPAMNADGSANPTAQANAVNAIVAAEVSTGVVSIPAEVNQQDMQWFSLDMVTSMDTNKGILLSPGTLLRVIDSYVVTSSVGGGVNCTQVNVSLTTLANNLASSGLLKLPPSITPPEVTAFAQSLARTMYGYKLATHRTTL